MKLSVTPVFLMFFCLFLISGCSSGTDSSKKNLEADISRKWERTDFSTELVEVYYWNIDVGYLVPEWIEIPTTTSITKKAGAIVDKLMESPGGNNLSPFGDRIEVGEIFFDGDGTMYIEISPGKAGTGEELEEVAMDALCRSIRKNFPEVVNLQFVEKQPEGGETLPLMHLVFHCG